MSNTLLNECRACNMKFESSDQLNNHTRKFCQGSDYSDVQKLNEKIYQKELKQLRQSKGTITNENMEKIDARKKRELQVVGQMSIADLKEKIRVEENEFRRLEAYATKGREDEMEKEINALREDRAKIRLEKKEDEQQLEDLMRELEIKKEKEIRNRIEKDQIRRALVDLEKAKLATIGTEKKRELDQIQAEKDAIKLKEKELLREIEEMDENQKQLEIMRNEEVNRMQQEVEKMQLQKKENMNVNMEMVQERAEKVTALQMRREQLEGEKLKIEKNLGHLRNGEFHLMQKEGVNYAVLSAKNLMKDQNDLKNYNIPGVRDKLKANEDRIKLLKNQHVNQQQPYDPDELITKDGNRGLTDNIAAYYEDKIKSDNRNGEIKGFRENMEVLAQRQDDIVRNNSSRHGGDLKKYADNVLGDLEQIKKQYKESGGDDPNFINQMSNLENFYNKTKDTGVVNGNQLNLSRLPPSLDGNLQQKPPTPNQPPQQQNNQPQHQNYQPPQQQPQHQSMVQQYQNNNQPNYNTPFAQNGNQFQSQSMVPFQQPQQFQQQQPINITLPQQGGQPFMSMQPNQLPMQQQIIMSDPTQQIANQQAGFTLAQMNGDKGNNPFGIFALKKEGFVQNAARNPDLTEEERTLMNLTAQEVDQLRMLSKLPVGTELYRFKMEQFKELSQTRSEIEKIVQEQRLQRLKRDYERERKDVDRRTENEKWIDDQRKFIISQKIKGEATDIQNYNPYSGGPSGGVPRTSSRQNPGSMSNRYTDNQGFVVFWDYALGLPARMTYCQIVFGIYNNGETIYSPKLVDPKDCDVQGNQQSRCIFGDTFQISEIPPNSNTIMVIELQIPFSKKIEENVGRTETHGWTVINLFDAKKEINRGKWKCPIYHGPTDPQIQLHNVKNLQPIQNCWIYLRLAYPKDDQIGQQRQLFPEQTMNSYQVAQIHNEGGANLQHMPNYMNNQSYEPSQFNESGRMRRPGSQRISNVSRDNYSDIHPQSAGSDDRVRRGLEVSVINLNNIVARSHIKVMVALMEGKTPMVDDNQLACLFNTSIHNPNSVNQHPIDDVVELNQQNPQLYNVSNKQDGDKIQFYEKYKFLIDLRKEFRRNKKDIYLGIQVAENKDLAAANLSLNQNQSIIHDQLDFQPIGWTFIQISKYDGSIITGDLKDVELYLPKVKPPPVDKSKVQKGDFSINLRLDLFQYDDNQLVVAQNERINNSKWN